MAHPSRSGAGVSACAAAVNADASAGNQQTVLLLAALIMVAVIVVQASAHGLANAGLTVSALSSDIVIVLVVGAASVYALLPVPGTRYREELRHRAATEDAMLVTPGKIDIDTPSSTTSGESPARSASGTSSSSRCVPTTPSTRPSPQPSRSSIVLIDDAPPSAACTRNSMTVSSGSRRARFRAVLHRVPQRR
jgi:MMPL family